MANPTAGVSTPTTPFSGTTIKRDLAATAATYYMGEMIAIDASGNAVKCDNTAGITFDGIMVGGSNTSSTSRVTVDSGDSAGDKKVMVDRPFRFNKKIASAVAGDEGKAVYALYSDEVAYSASASIQVGWVDKVVSSTEVSIRPTWAGVRGNSTFDGATLTFNGSTGGNTVVMPDNLADALSITEASNNYITFVTTNSAEQINVKKTVSFTGTTGNNIVSLVDNLADSLNFKESTNSYLKFVTTNSGETVVVTPLLTAVAGISFTGVTTANVMKLTDNLADALNIKEGTNSYLKFITTDSAEAVVLGKALTSAVGASTAGLGTNSGTAAALPAGTALIYPTTAADDTVGVIISTADKVTGRMLFIGNGVSNKILKIYPPSGGTINGAAGDAAFSTGSGKGAWVVCLSSGGNTWLALG